ncbi:HIT family protein [Sinomonas terrae]|uniref:HIT family protein n=1 Tax=Sinomonas terrae TaxID=2908838 RepID=A0ABS9TZ57_9MICC|nr:HIT family protein [Sinomonas terrae]MCH6469724.1 HIT family protein [Sinomonas terrae]
MTTIFTKIIDGEIPGRFVWKDDDVVAFLTIAPLADGHTLVVPREEVDRWTDASPELLSKVMSVAQQIGQAQVESFDVERAGMIIAGFEVHHLHVHVWPATSEAEFNFQRAQHDPDPAAMDAAAEKLRQALRDRGHGEFVPES